MSDDQRVTVCSACLRASCWQGIFYCEEYRTAGTKRIDREYLLKYGSEHPCYLKTDDELEAEANARVRTSK